VSGNAAVRRGGLAVLALAVLSAAGILATRPLGYDFAAYWLAARRLLEGAPLYPAAGEGAVYLGFGEFLYEPLVAVAFVPLALLPFETAAWLWTGLLVVLATVLSITLVRPFRPDVRPWAAAGCALFFPLLADISLGNLNLVSVALALGAWWLRDRPRAAGAVLTAAIGLKLLPVALLLFYAGARRWRLVGWSLATGAALIAASMPFLADRWADYLRLFASVARESSEFAINVIPSAVSGSPLRFVLPVAAVAVAYWAGTRERAGAGDGAHHLALAAAPLVSPLVWYPYLVFALPAVLAGSLAAARARSVALAAIVVASWLALEVPSGRGPLPDIAFAGLVALVISVTAIVHRTTTPSR
jgi:alpha-1,2-mannosyltransferase